MNSQEISSVEAFEKVATLERWAAQFQHPKLLSDTRELAENETDAYLRDPDILVFNATKLFDASWRLNDVMTDEADYYLSEAILNKPISIARGNSCKSTDWQADDTTVGKLLARLGKFERGPKDGGCILQGSLVSSLRNASDVKACHIMMFDHDTGESLAEIISKVSRENLFCMLWTTHSHMKNETSVPAAKIDQWMKEQNLTGEPDAEIVGNCLLSMGKIVPELLVGAVLREEEINGKASYVLKHQPMPRIRSLFVSKEAFAFNGKTATLEWKERYAGVATRLGFAYDESCTDPSRLMYTPRIPDGAEIGEGKHEIIIIPGGELDLMNAERVANGSKRTSKGGAGRRSGAPTGERGEGDFETQGLKKFLAKYDKDFEAENFMEHFYPERFINKNGPKAHFRCPNEDSHSELKLNDTAFMVVNASEGESGFYMGCLHAGCIAASGKDRAWYLDLVCQDLKIAHAKELLEWCPNYQAKKTENEQAKALGADEKALKEAIGALSKDGGSADTEAVLRAIATISNEFWRGSAINDVKKKIGGSVPFLRETVKRYRKEQDEWEEQSEWGKQSDDEEDDDNGKPVVWVDRSYPEQVDALMQGLVDLNGSDPRIFSNLEGGIVKVSDDEKKTISREMTERRWHTYLGKTIIFKKHRQGSETTQSIAPTHDLVKHLLGLIDPPFPMLKKILRVPVFGPDGTLRWERGYDEAMEAYVAPDFVGREVPDVVSREHVDEALYHLKEVLWDFPFSDTFDGSDILSVKSNKLNDDGFPLPNYERGESSRAHAMAMLLQPFARNMIDGPCPAYHVDKPAPGTGAGYLVNAVFMIAEGEPAKVQSMSNSDEELRKRITALLREGTRIVFFDNINRKVVSPVLAAAVTATKWTDRVLGVSDTVTTDVEVAWIMAGNNLSFSREMMRRNVPIRLDAVVVDPSRDRGAKDFKHYPLQDWLSDERANLVWACHVLIKNWVQGGMVWGTKTMASFEAWAGVMGGILECAGVRGFLDNIKSYLKDKDEDEDVASQLVQLCYDKHGMMPMRVADILSATKGLYGEDLIELPIKGYDVKELVKNLGIYMNEIATRTFKINLTGTQTTEGAESQNATPDEQTQLVKLIKARKQNPAKWRLDPAPK